MTDNEKLIRADERQKTLDEVEKMFDKWFNNLREIPIEEDRLIFKINIYKMRGGKE